MYRISKRKKRSAFFIAFGLLLVLAVAFFSFDAALEEYVETTLNIEIHEKINKGLKEYIQERAALFDGLIFHEYAPNGTLVSVRMDTAKMGLIQSGLEATILDAIRDMESTGFTVPSGNLVGSKLLSGKGPRIKIETVPLGTLACDTVNEFESVGINHTLHSVALVFTVKLKAAAPLSGTVLTERFTVRLCESIIIGKVPDYILN